LIRESGETELVELITKQDNFAYIFELVKYKKLIVWAKENGFSLAELAWIQPGYPPAPKQINQVGNGGGANGEITVMKSQTSRFYIAGDFTEIDGFAANGIVSWDGENWENLGEGLLGQIDEIEISTTLIIASGDFTIVGTGQQTQLALFKDGTWTSLLDENFEGEIRSMASIGIHNLYVGGDFSEINGIAFQNIARYNLTGSNWLDSDIYCSLGTNAPVNSVIRANENIYFAGDFSQISYTCDQEVSTLETNALGIYKHYENELSLQPYFGGFEKLDEVHVHNGVLRAYEHRAEETYVHGLTGGTWSSVPYYNMGSSIGTPAPALLHGFMETYGENSGVLLYGDTQSGGGISFIYGDAIVSLSSDGYPTSSGLILPNGPIRAASHYNGQIYFAGDFTEIQGESFNGLASSDFSLATSIESEIPEVGIIQVFQDDNQLITRFKDLEHETNFTLYNMNGKAIASQKLAVGSGQVEMNLWNKPAGMYFYTVENESGMRSEKVLIMQ
jgi:hypothetical protein